MVSFKTALVLSSAALMAQAQTIPLDLVGTWSSKSNSTLTGSGFYDPVNDHFTEPKHTGISYSFSKDGFFEEAYYRAVANPINPKCPKGIMQWQHGKFSKSDDGKLKLEPIKVDGRQLYSDPCEYSNSVYTRYNATETFKRYEVVIDKYHQVKRLNLFKADGAPLMPLYIAFEGEPNMLPTTTLNPLVTATATASKQKRGEIPHEILFKRSVNSADQWFWGGLFLTAGGGILYMFF